MEVDLLCIFLLASLLTVSVQSAPREKQKSFDRWAQNSEEKDDEFPNINDSILPTFFPFEASSPEPANEDVRKEMSNGGDKTSEVYSLDLEVSDGTGIPVLLSEEMLAQLIKASEEEHQDVEKDEENSDEDDIEKVADTNVRNVEISSKPINDGEEQQWQQKEKGFVEGEVGSSPDSEIPVDFDYADDSISTQTQNSKMFGEEENVDNELPTVMEDYDTHNQDYENPKDGQEEKLDQAMLSENLQDKQILPNPETETSSTDEVKESRDLEEKTPFDKKKG
ncbi:SPARC-like protein 1 [Tachysurus ichikawai]